MCIAFPGAPMPLLNGRSNMILNVIHRIRISASRPYKRSAHRCSPSPSSLPQLRIRRCACHRYISGHPANPCSCKRRRHSASVSETVRSGFFHVFLTDDDTDTAHRGSTLTRSNRRAHDRAKATRYSWLLTRSWRPAGNTDPRPYTLASS